MGLTRPRFSQFDTTISSISDPVTVLNKSSTLANIDIGFILNRNGGALANTAIFWNEGANTFALAFTTNSGELPNANIAISAYANLQVNTLNSTFINATGNVSATYFTGSGQFLTGLPAGYSNVNVTAYTETMGFQNYGNVNVVAYLGGNITVGNIIVPTGAGRFNGPFNESTTIQGVYVGNLNLSPRIGFFNGTAAQNWQIDNNFGTFRWYTPGVVRMTIDTGGNLNVPSGNIMSAGNVTAAYFLGNGALLTGIVTSGGGNNFGNIFINGQNPVLADTTSDTLTIVGGTGIYITTDAANDSVTFSSVQSGAFGTSGDFGAITDTATVIEDEGSVADGATLTYDLGSIISASGLIYPDQLVLPIYTTASLPNASMTAAQLIYDSTSQTVDYSDGSNWQRVAAQSYAVAMSVALG